jgi:phospholipid N-methyltransferase
MIRNTNGRIVLELGPGTGVFTKEILNKLPKDGILVSIESNEIFTKYLRKNIKDSRLRLITGDALLMKKYLAENGIDKVDYIVSGLPLGHFSKDLKNKILTEAKNCLKDDGKFIQFEYFLAGIKSVKKFFPKVDISFELLNMPPAFVIECKKI